MTLSLRGKVAIVTGASRGIGLCIADTFAANGAHLILVGRSSEHLESVAKNITDSHNVDAHVVVGDVAQSATSKEAVSKAFSTYKRLDILVNNAGVLQDGLIGMISEKDIDETMSTNTKGVINFTQATARLMIRGGGGSIVNISSIIGRFGNKGQLVYATSKAAVIGATLSAAKELASPGVRVNAIAPGYINTDMIKDIPDEIDEERRASIGMPRIGEPVDVANLALFLASDMSSYITGQVIGVDGSMLV